MNEILAAEQRMQIKLTASQRETVEALLDGRLTWAGAYAMRVYKSILAAR